MIGAKAVIIKLTKIFFRLIFFSPTIRAFISKQKRKKKVHADAAKRDAYYKLVAKLTWPNLTM